MSHKVDAYTIYDIAKWQVELEENTDKQSANTGGIQMPTIQRGFVWQPHQMEALWDSILRGYPVGSLLMSKDVNNTKYLLDGQQRCTTIALGFQDPLKTITNDVHNIKKENSPSVWIDLKPLRDNQNGLRFAVRVLTRSHPWGYRLNNHAKRLSMADQRNALDYFRKRSDKESLGFSQLDVSLRSPWDAYFPVPLALVLKTDRSNLRQTIANFLQNIETKYGVCDYTKMEESWLDDLYRGVASAKNLLLPEVIVDKSSIEEDDVNTENETGQDAILFLRLNSSGTRISGQELIYSLIKASLPEAKELVEEIGLNFLSPTTVVNLFVRFIKMQRRDFQTFERNMSLQDFRKLMSEDGFKEDLKTFIFNKEAKTLMDKAVVIIKSHPSDLPSIFHKEVLSKNTDLLLVLLVYIHNNDKLDKDVKKSIRKSFLHTALFTTSKEKKKISPAFFKFLKENKWQNWGNYWSHLVCENPNHLPFLIPPEKYREIINILKDKYIDAKDSNLFIYDWLKQIFENNDDIVKILSAHLPHIIKNKGDLSNDQIIEASIGYWKHVSHYIFWKKDLLILSQREYFNEEFKDYMAFDGIEDTNKPWNWDHIYPNSWVHNKNNISNLVKQLVNSNGNYRALSFNKNRSQSNNQSPNMRFEGNRDVQKESFICCNDLEHWLELTNNDKRLIDKDPKITSFVNAVLERIGNIYEECYKVTLEIE